MQLLTEVQFDNQERITVA